MPGEAPRHADGWLTRTAEGWLLMEHGYDQAAAVRALLQAEGFDAVASARDLAGIERVTLGRYPLRGVDAGARQA